MPDYPDVPPGVQMFNPRRFRRHARNRALASHAQKANERMRDAEKAKQALANALSNSQRKVRELEMRKTLWGRARLFFARHFKG